MHGFQNTFVRPFQGAIGSAWMFLSQPSLVVQGPGSEAVDTLFLAREGWPRTLPKALKGLCLAPDF